MSFFLPPINITFEGKFYGCESILDCVLDPPSSCAWQSKVGEMMENNVAIIQGVVQPLLFAIIYGEPCRRMGGRGGNEVL